jgi:hypothetical protein
MAATAAAATEAAGTATEAAGTQQQHQQQDVSCSWTQGHRQPAEKETATRSQASTQKAGIM